MRPGPHNALTDVPGLRVGHAQVAGGLTGTTVVLAPPEGAVAGVDVRGAAPGTRETDLLHPGNTVGRVHAIVLSGGSAYGLAAADGVMARLEVAGTGFPVPGGVVPIVPAAVVFDLGRGGAFGLRPDASTGAAAFDAACDGAVAQGVVGAGTGAVVGGLKGGVGTASAVLESGATVAALVVLNAVGSAVDPATGLPYGVGSGLGGEFAAVTATRPDASPQAPASAGPASPWDPAPEGSSASPRDPASEGSGASPRDPASSGSGAPPQVPAPGGSGASPQVPTPGTATTLAVVATDVTLDKAGAARLATMGHDGLARAIVPVHTVMDGDTIFGLATCARPVPPLEEVFALHATAAEVVTRAVVHALLAAETVTTSAGTWRGFR